MGALSSVAKGKKAWKAYNELQKMKKRHYKSNQIRNKYKSTRKNDMLKAGAQAAGAVGFIKAKQHVNCPTASPSLPDKLKGLGESFKVYKDYRWP